MSITGRMVRLYYHLDAYRLENATEGEDLDLELMLERGSLVVEWPENIRTVLPVNALTIAMHWMADEHRGLVISAVGEGYREMLDEIRRQVYGGY